MSRVGLFHFDLDGVGCQLLMSKIFNFDKYHACGYGKIKKYIEDDKLSGYESCIIADVSLEHQQYDKLSIEYKNKLLYIDHHKPSVDMINSLSNNKSMCVVDTKFSGTAICFKQLYNKLRNVPNIHNFVSAVNAYDMWKYKTQVNLFSIGYDLNVLFWKYGFYKFADRFSDDMNLKFDYDERKWIDSHKKDRDYTLSNSDMTNFGENSLLVVDAPKMYLIDYTLQYDYDVYFLIYINTNGKLVLSIRSSIDNDRVNVGNIARSLKENNDNIITAGGHPQSAGIDFDENVGFDDVINIVQEINDKVEYDNIELVPF